MVNQSQLEIVQKLVQTSTHLSAKEREEWSSLLPFMNDKQLADLANILELTPAPSPEPKQVVPVKLAKPSEAFTEQSGGRQKINTPAPALEAGPPEIDLPAPKAVSAPVAPAPAAPKPKSEPASVNTVSAFINRNFAPARASKPAAPVTQPKPQPSISAPAPAVAPQPATPAPAPVLPQVPQGRPETERGVAGSPAMDDITPPKDVVAPVAAPTVLGGVPTVPAQSPIAAVPPVASAVVPEPEAVMVAEEIVPTLQSLEDIRRVNVATLRGRGVLTIENELRALCQKFGYFSVQFAIEHSPLYQTYLAVGSKVLKEHQTFEEVQAALSGSGHAYLTKPEFEEVTDLLQRIKSN